jgi:hypothetical protein
MTGLTKMIPRSSMVSYRGSSWEDEAACIGKHRLFDIIPTPRHAEGDVADTIKRENLANFAQAAVICASCPVLSECGTNASPEDLRYTFRAGKVPRSFSPRTVGRPSRPDKNTCKRGHVGMYRMRKGKKRDYRECLGCRSVISEKSRRKKGVKPKA